MSLATSGHIRRTPEGTSTARYLTRRIIAGQRSDGAFGCSVERRGETIAEDWNGFVTALTVLALQRIPAAARGAAIIASLDRALGYLSSCRRSDRFATYGFWPAGHEPHFAAPLPADADDTALMLLALGSADVVTRAEIRETCCHALLRHRVGAEHPGPDWIRQGSFYTWLHDDPRNIVDCAVNANVLALLADQDLLGLPGVSPSIDMIRSAVRWAAGDPARLAAATPFYPHPSGLVRAVDRAVSAGVVDLELVAQELAVSVAPTAVQPHNDRDLVCSSAYGLISWRAPVVALAESLAGSLSASRC